MSLPSPLDGVVVYTIISPVYFFLSHDRKLNLFIYLFIIIIFKFWVVKYNNIKGIKRKITYSEKKKKKKPGHF